MLAWYNEPDPFAANWLESLIAHGLIADGIVYRQPIQRVRPADLTHFQQFHFFAGIGGWSYALRLAGWPDSLPVWTGSCPCQPFSNAGSKRGTLDDRHLWPYFRNLIALHRPPVVFGEQVASPLGRSWLSSVRADLEELGYGVGCADLCAASVGAPHIRQRLYWVAESMELSQRAQYRESRSRTRQSDKQGSQAGSGGVEVARLGISTSGERRIHGRYHQSGDRSEINTSTTSIDQPSAIPCPGPCDVWAQVEYLALSDQTLRPTQPGLFPLAPRLPGRLGLLRGYGNSIVPQLAAEFIGAYMDVREGSRQ